VEPVQVSVVIVNYNVEHFLELCLESVFKNFEGISSEVLVVDNHSSDGSCALVKKKFPQAILIENQENVGFSKANNQGILQAKGEFILLLNPDTILPGNCISQCLDFMKNQPEAGCLGARMLDGSGSFLPESKRGLPTPWVSFCKAFGLSFLFPNSSSFGKYHLSYIPENQTAEVDVLSGAFMFIRKKALDQAGLLDESFFMYGEDVDLSFRLQKTGFKNYYHSKVSIIHFKGESTKRGSISFVKHFYKAMLLFSKKHFSQNPLFSLFIYVGIGVRASIALLRRFWNWIGNPAIEFGLAYFGMVFIKNWWELNFKGLPGMYPDIFIRLLIPGYLLIWIGSIRLISRFSDEYGHQSIIKGIAVGTVLISGFTNFFDDYRFSKGLILIGAVWTYVVVSARFILAQWLNGKRGKLKINRQSRWLIVGNEGEFKRVKAIFPISEKDNQVLGWVGDGNPEQVGWMGKISEIKELAYRLGIDQLLFCFGGISEELALNQIQNLNGSGLQFSFLGGHSDFIVSSSEKHKRGLIFQSETIPAICLPYNLRLKRLADISICILLLGLFPFLFWKFRSVSGFFSGMIMVLAGKKSWIGLANNDLAGFGVKQGIISMRDLAGPEQNEIVIKALDELYRKEFIFEMEIWTVLKNMDRI
jgi:GT2 family glycosyltransferase